MKKLTAILCLVAIVLFGTITFACAAQKKTDKMKVEPFTKIELGVGITASYVQGPFAPLKFTGSREALDRIMVTTSHGTLEIKYRNKGQNSNNGRNNVQVTIQAPEITSFDLATGAVLNIPDGICTQNKLSFDLSTGAVATIKGVTATKLEFDLSTGAVLNATKINSQHLEADLSTGAVATIAGNCTRAELEASTGAIINAAKLLTTTAEVSASVGAQIDYNARHTTEVSKGLGAQVNNHAR